MKMMAIPLHLQQQQKKRGREDEEEDEDLEYNPEEEIEMGRAPFGQSEEGGESNNNGGPAFVEVGITHQHIPPPEDDDDLFRLLNDRPTNRPRINNNSPSGGGGGETPQPTIEQPVEEKEYFIPVPLTSTLHERTLGDPGPRANCFGCCYYGEKETTIPSEAIVKLIEMSRQSIGRICLVTLAHGMAEYYDIKIRQPVNAKLKPGQRPLPYWPAAQILDHIYNHTQDPLIQQVVLLSKTKEVVNKLENCLFERSSKTGIEKPNKYNIECFDKMVKLLLFVQKQDASKMAFHSAGARINPEILDQGILTTHNKKLHDYLKK